MTISSNTPELAAASPLNDAKAQRKLAWPGRSRGGVFGNWFFITVLRLLGLRAAYLVLIPVSLYFALTDRKAWRASAAWRERAGCAQNSWIGRLWGGWRHFFTFGQILLDRFALIWCADRFRVDFQGGAQIRAALDKGKGLVLISAHLGNWMAAAHILAQHSVPVNIVAFQGEDRRIQALLDKALSGRQFSVIAVDGSIDSSLAIISALRRGEIVAVHGDRCLGLAGERCEFLGEPAFFPVGPYVAAAVCGAPIVHAFGVREGTYHYRLLAHGPMEVAFSRSLDRTSQIRSWMQDFIEQLQDIARQYPLQWLNFYDFWGKGGRDGAPAT